MAPPKAERPAPLTGNEPLDHPAGELDDQSLRQNPTFTQELFAPQGAVIEAPEFEEVDIDWEHDEAVILHEQCAVAAYYNKHGELVVNQRTPFGDTNAVFIAPENIDRFLVGLKQRAKRGGNE